MVFTCSKEKTTFTNAEKYLEVEVGDFKQVDFFPQIKFKKWDNEANFSIRLIDDDTDKELSWYSTDRGYEFDITLKEKPKTNIIQFTMQSKELDFFYQGPLEVAEGDISAYYVSDDIEGSYAIYHKTKANNKYGCGKFGHLYRPKLQDANGEKVFADMEIKDDLLIITIPQDFLDKAVYPIKRAGGAEFGVTTTGATGRATTNCRGGLMALGEAGTITELHGYTKATTTATYNMACYDSTSGTSSPPTNLKGYTAGGSINSTAGWREYSVASNFDLASGNYFLQMQGDAEYYYYTDSTTWTTAGRTGYVYPWADPFGASNFSTNYKISIHAVYTVTAAGTTNYGINVGDEYKDITETYVNVGDVWKKVQEKYVNVGDVWKIVP